jgi:hypothetical protein
VLVTAGLIVHFLISLRRSLRRRRSAAPSPAPSAAVEA